MNGVSVIPHDAEVSSGGLHGGQLLGYLCGDGDAGWVAEHRDGPQALDLWVLDQFLDGVDVRAVF